MQTFRYLMVLGVGTTLTLGSMPSAFSSTAPERTVKFQNFLRQSQQSDSHHHFAPLLLADAPSGIDSASTARDLESPNAEREQTGSAIRIAQGNPPGPQLPPLEPANPTPTTPTPTPQTPAPTAPAPTPAPTAPAPTPPPPAAPTPASPEDLNLNRLNPGPNLLEVPTKPSDVQLQLGQPITLQQALELARRNNRDLQVAELTLRRARSSLREAQAALYPTVGAQAEFRGQRADGLAFDPPPAGSPPGTPSTPTIRAQGSRVLSGTVEANYDVYTSGRRTATIRAAEQQVRFNELEVERLTEQLRLDVSTDYYDLQQADEQVRIDQAAVENDRASLRDAQALERAGLGTRFDVLQAEVQLANDTQTLTNDLSQRQIALRQLAQRLSLGSTANVTAADPVRRSADWGRSLEESIVLAFQNRAELEQRLAERNISEQQRRIALSELGPQLSLFANYSVREVDGDDVGPLNTVALGPRVTLNVFDGGAARARAAQEETNIRIAETNFANTRNQIRFEVEQAYSNLQASFKNIQTSSVALARARESLRLARLRFQAGVGIQSDVLDAVAALTQAEGNRVQAILGYNRDLVSLQRFVSNLQATAPAIAPPSAGPSASPFTAPAVVP